MAQEAVTVAIVGSGPGGLSAAVHAAELGQSHILLESSETFSNTIQRYQKGKLVMAEPSYLPLRSDVGFDVGTREQVLDTWDNGISEHKVNIRYKAEVTGISGQKGDFTLTIADGGSIRAEHVVLAIGVQGNPRKIAAPGGDLPFIQYTLDDPDEYQDESIVVIGAGDSAIENALGLAKQNEVFIVNRKDEFARAKPANIDKILASIEDGSIKCFYKSTVDRVESGQASGKPGLLVLKTEEGEAEVACDRIIARLGAIPPRKFVESCGIEFPSTKPAALPTLTTRYESTVPGLYVVGALGGYPLIKQAMNQGYEVVEYLLGRDIKPADHELLAERLQRLPYELDVDVCMNLLQQRVPMFAEINPLMFREFMLESTITTFSAGDVIYQEGEYTNSFFTVIDGEVMIGLSSGLGHTHMIRQGEFFGEISLISGRRRSNTATAQADCLLIETPRRVMNKLRASIDTVREGIDQLFIARVLQEVFTPTLSVDELREIAVRVELNSYAPGDLVFREGEAGECLHVIRVGSVTLLRETDENPSIVGYVHSGGYVGETSIMNTGRYTETARAEVAVETIKMGRDELLALIGKDKSLVKRMQNTMREGMATYINMESVPARGKIVRFLMDHGLGEATDALIINESLCVGCDNCEFACANTHGGVSRLKREAGPSFAGIHVPVACRHCEQPHCMKDCPTNSILRTQAGEVFIDHTTCIGCGNCYNNCPYGVISMASLAKPAGTGFLGRLFGGGRSAVSADSAASSGKKAVKCDLCKDLDGGPACVRSCPTGAALRVKPEDFSKVANRYVLLQ